MPVIGPGSPSEELVNKIHAEVLDFLKEKHNILKFKPLDNCFDETKKERLEALRKAIYDLIEVDYWEGF